MNFFFLFSFFLILKAQAQDDTVRLSPIHVLDREESTSLMEYVPAAVKLSGKSLQKRREISLGETLKNEVGISSTNYGPNASRPVVRGLDGDRIKVLQNGLNTLDASSQSLDHATPVDMLNADQVELIRGPMSLMYAPTAIGGVINITNQRIHSDFEEGLLTQLETQADSVNNGLSNGARLDYGKNQWMFHADGSLRNLGDQKIPGDARSNKLQQTSPLSPGETESKNKLKDSFNQQNTASVGVSRIFDRGHLGLSYNRFRSQYGTVAEPDVSIFMNQDRYELSGDYRLDSALFHTLRVRSAQSHYKHEERENGNTGTQFRNKGNETRLEGLSKINNWNGATGVQTQMFKFAADGEEAFLPTSNNQTYSFFTFHDQRSGQNHFSLAARSELAKIQTSSSTNFGSAQDRSFTGLNGSLQYDRKFLGQYIFTTQLSYTERTPNFQELFAQGAHLATGTFEQGDSSLKKEKSKSIEFSLTQEKKERKTTINFFAQQFDHFIALSPTGTTDGGSGLPIYAYQGVGALFYGAEFNSRTSFKQHFTFISKADYVRAKNRNNGENLPRISPLRLTLALEYQKNLFGADIELQHLREQTATAPNETRTPQYTLLNMGVTYDLKNENHTINLFARIKNLTNREARNHVSTLKDIAPLPGRNFVIGAQAVF